MVKRKLNSDEMALCATTLKQRENEQEWFKYQIEFHALMLDKGLEVNYQKTLQEYKNKKKDFENQAEINKQAIKIIQEQMRNGVEMKEDVDDKNSVEGGGEE